jgi:ABC-2 type transport system ATP-binding protein
MLISSHILSEVEQVCDRVIIIHRGKIVAQGSPAALRQDLLPPPALLITTSASATDVLAIAQKIDPSAQAREAAAGTIRVELSATSQARAQLLAALIQANLSVTTLTEEPTGLEAIFLAATRRETPEAPVR